ncbi:SgcJ/EcaC family oxidoreductase [Amycolatopsis minnesotensis]|uniref:DUF4440 domain-containing protein n=1 Tax=Amycolatopsis minnesotensis TaxID=337894 RepID=A0ABP5D6Q1_9PSEU
MTTPRPSLVDEGTDEDRAAIAKIIEDTEIAYNTNDPDLMTEHFALDATVVNAVGGRASGWAALYDANKRGLAGFLHDEYVRYQVTGIDFLGQDTALAYKAARATKPDGDLIDADPAMVALYVMVKRDGRWWVAARQNTLVPA